MPLDIIIVGGGIGGLAAAIGFRKDGHRVIVLEQAKELAEIGAAIGMGPNATGCLWRLGVRDRLEGEAVRPRAWTHRRWLDGRQLGAYPLGTFAESRFGHPFWMLHRANLHKALLFGATDPDLPGDPADLRLGMRVTSVAAHAEQAEAKTADGQRFVADLIIGADGVRSRVRENLFGRDEPVFSGNAVIRVQLPTDEMLDVDELKPFVEDESIETWLGPGAHIVHAPICAGKVFNFAVCFTSDAVGGETWFTPGNKDELLARMAGWYPPILRIIESGELVGRWDLYDREPLPNWWRGRTCLLGDAAHAMMPYLGQGAAQTLEDALALVDALKGVSSDGLPPALTRYETFRKPRARAIQQSSRSKRDLYHLPDGPAQQRRDAHDDGNGDLNDFNWIWQMPQTAHEGVII